MVSIRDDAVGIDEAGVDRGFTRNAVAVAVSGAVTGVFGLLFWFAAGRLFPAASVGAASVLINTTTMVSTLSSAALGGMYERFLGNAHADVRSLVFGGQCVTVFLSVCLSVILATAGPLNHVVHGSGELAAYAVFQATMCIYALQDHVATGLGVARWSAAKNIVHAGAKLLMLVGIATAATPFAIVFSWWLPALVTGAVLAFVTSKRMRRAAQDGHASTLPPVRELWSFFFGSLGLVVAGTAIPLAMPLIVVARFGITMSAYFAISWSVISAAVIVMHMLVGPFVAAVSTCPPESSVHLLRRFGLILTSLAVLAGLGLGILGPLMLKLVGHDYYVNGRALMYFAALTVPLAVVLILYQASSRVLRKLRLAVVLEGLSAAIVLVGISISPTDRGLVVVGMWFLIAQGVVAVFAVAPLVRNLTRLTDVRLL